MSNHRIDTQRGEFVCTRRSGDGVTMWIEGSDSDGPSVSGTYLNGPQLAKLIARLSNLQTTIQEDSSERA